LHLFNPLFHVLTSDVLPVPQRSLVLILQVLQLVAELPLRRQPLLPLPVNLLVSPLLLSRLQVLTGAFKLREQAWVQGVHYQGF
jgi:hypothetical protein